MSDQEVDIEKLVKLVDDKFKPPTIAEYINAFTPSKYLLILLVLALVVLCIASLFTQPATWIPWLLTAVALGIASASFLVVSRPLAKSSLLKMQFDEIFPHSEDKSEQAKLLLFPLIAMKMKNQTISLVVLYEMHRELFKKEKLLEWFCE